MKNLVLLTLVLIYSATPAMAHQAHDPERDEQDYEDGFFDADVDMTEEDERGGENHSELPAPGARIQTINRNFFRMLLSFPQTKWNECTDRVTGNYADFNCTASRNISVILDTYLQDRLMECVDAGLAEQGGGKAKRIHVTHAGITGDDEHSVRSLHSVNRAIDVKVIKVDKTDGSQTQFTYSKLGNRPFYTGLRKCWGKVVSRSNGCPLYNGSTMLTGSIGWENSNHGRHMHLSVPYCVNGQYGSGLWRR